MEYSIPDNIFVNGKFVPNVDKVKVPLFKKSKADFNPPNWTGVQSCGKTPEQMYKYLFPFD